MNYTLHQLRIFLELVKTRSITKSAEALHLTQPAVSIQLKNFQQQFKVPLWEVLQKKIFITDFGKEIAFSAEKIMEEVYAINFKMHAHLGQLSGKLKFSVVSTGKYIAPFFISDFIRAHPGVELLMDVTNKIQVLNSLEKNETDFALVSVLPEYLRIDKVELLQNKLFLVGNNQYRFSKKENSKQIFEQLSLIYREQGSGTRHVMEKFLSKNKVIVNKKMELMSNEAVKQAVISGLGCSIMPLIGIKNELQSKQLQIIPVKSFPIKSTWYLIWLKEKKMSPLASSYLHYIKQEKQNIIQRHFDWFEKYE